MSDNWVVQNLQKALATWNEKLQEIWTLLTVSPEEFRGGRIWTVILDIHSGIQAIGLAPLAVMFQFQTGVRIGELCAVRYEDIEGDEIYISRMYRFETKELVDFTKGHNEGRYVPLTAEARRIIDTARTYQKEHGLCDNGFIFSVDEEPLSYYSVRKLYEKYCKKIGTYVKSSHKSRMTYISALIDGGVNINAIREMVGHADERTTYNSYCYDKKTKLERITLVEQALS